MSENGVGSIIRCEVGNKYPRDVEVLKHKLDVRGIQICNAWFSTFLVNGKKEETIAELLDIVTFYMPWGKSDWLL